MPKTMMLALALLFSTAWLAAQNQYPQTSPSQSGTAGSTTIQGCLQESNGNYTLTSDSGMTYQLQGSSSTLSKHVGHEVRITGSTSSAGGSSSATTGEASGKSQELTVDNLKHISKTCSNKSK
jgi:hypothetical protein